MLRTPAYCTPGSRSSGVGGGVGAGVLHIADLALVGGIESSQYAEQCCLSTWKHTYVHIQMHKMMMMTMVIMI